MQEGAPNQQPSQQPDGPAPEQAHGSGEGSFGTPPPPDPAPPGSGRNLKLIVVSIVVLVLLAGAAVAAYALVGLGGNTSPEAPEITPPAEPAPSPSASASLSPNQQVAVLKPVGAAVGDASGEAARSTSGGRFVLAVSVKLPDPESGSFYEVFLRRPGTEAEFSAGRMYEVGGRWVMTLDQARDASAYGEVRVTLETKDDGRPEEPVLGGAF